MSSRMRVLSTPAALLVALAFAGPASAQVTLVSTVQEANTFTPRWSPDGKRLAYEYHNPGKDHRGVDILVMDGLTVKETIHVEPDTALEGFGSKKNPPVKDLTWHPKGRGFIYASTGGRHMFNIYMDGEGNLTGGEAYGGGNKIQPTFSFDGGLLAFAKEESDGGDIFLVDIYNQENGPRKMTETESDTSYQPRFSPDGKTLLFTRMIEKLSSNDLFIITDLEKPKESTKKLTTWKGDELNASFSPDGKLVALFSNQAQKDPKKFDLWVVKPDGTDQKLLVSDVVKPDRSNPVWTPDSTRLLLVKVDEKTSDAITWVKVDEPKTTGAVKTNTLLNNDLDLFVLEGGKEGLLAFTAQGQVGDKKTRWKQVYVAKVKLDDFSLIK